MTGFPHYSSQQLVDSPYFRIMLPKTTYSAALHLIHWLSFINLHMTAAHIYFNLFVSYASHFLTSRFNITKNHYSISAVFIIYIRSQVLSITYLQHASHHSLAPLSSITRFQPSSFVSVNILKELASYELTSFGLSSLHFLRYTVHFHKLPHPCAPKNGPLVSSRPNAYLF